MQTTRKARSDDLVPRSALIHARAILPLTHHEAEAMAKLELERFLALVTSLAKEKIS